MRNLTTYNFTMKHHLISLGAFAAMLSASFVLSSCGEAEQASTQAAPQIDPEARKAALAKLQELGMDFSPRSFSKVLAGNCKAEVLKLFLDAGISANARTASGAGTLIVLIINSVDKEETVKCAELLIKSGADVRLADNTGQTALHYAVGRANPELVKLLIASGADVNAVDRRGFSVLERTFSSEITEILKAAGAQERKPANSIGF